MTLEPAVILWFVGVEVVEDDVDGRVGMSGDMKSRTRRAVGASCERPSLCRWPPRRQQTASRSRCAAGGAPFWSSAPSLQVRRVPPSSDGSCGFRDAAHASLNQDLFISDSGYQGGFR